MEIPETGAESPTAVADHALVPAAKRQAYLADAGLVGVTVVWGSTFVVIKGALAGIGPFEFVALRFAVAFLALAILFHKRIARLTSDERRAGSIIGLFLFAGYAFQTAGLQYTTASTSAFITGLCVVFVPIVDVLVLGQRVGKGVVFAVVLAPIGLWLITVGQQTAFGPGDLLTLACALAFAGHIVSIGVYASRFDPIALALVQIGVVAALAMFVSVAVERPLEAPGTAVLLAVLYTGLLGSALVLGVQTKIQRYTTATHAALIFSLEPVFAAAFAYVFAGETLGVTGLLGAALMLGAMFIAEFRR